MIAVSNEVIQGHAKYCELIGIIIASPTNYTTDDRRVKHGAYQLDVQHTFNIISS
jgi:hypothetical protein